MIKKILNVSFFQILITVLNFSYGLSLASFFGASEQMDAYVVVSNFTLTLSSLFIGTQTKTLIPFLSKYKDSPEINNIISSILRFNILLFFTLSITFFLFSKWITILLAPGLSQNQLIIASNALKILSAFLLLSSFCGLGQGLLEFKLQFEKPQIINLLKAVLSIVLLFGFVKIIGIYSAPLAGISSFSIISLIYFMIFHKHGIRLSASLKIYNKYIQQYLHLLYPMLLASLSVWMISFVDTFIASFFDTGSISYLGYCRRIINNVSNISSSSVCLVYYPILSHLTQEGDDRKYQETFLKGIQTVFTITVISTTFLLLYAKPVITVLFKRGAFSAHDIDNVVHLLRYFCYVLIGGPFGAFLANLYYAKRRMKLVNVLSVLSAAVNLILDCILGYFYGIIGLALASSIAFFTGNILFILFLSRITQGYKIRYVVRKIISPLFAGIVTFFIAFYFKKFGLQFEQIQYFYIKVLYIFIHFIIYFLIFIVLCLLFRVEIVCEMMKKSINNIKNKYFYSGN